MLGIIIGLLFIILVFYISYSKRSLSAENHRPDPC